MQSEKSRIKNLSTRYLKFYKRYLGFIIVLVFVGFLLREFQFFGDKETTYWVVFPILVNFFLLWWHSHRKLFQIEFDEDFLYVGQGNQDILIPLENIKDVNLISVVGVYQVDLYSKETFGKKFYFKPSFLYPFNHKESEALIDVLWANIEKAKRKKQDFQRNALMS
jgi:hypothetical protein